jgi:hypothetical protein|tara:strand:- start:984 stop:1466 length:483 start_codon:yes stop_codon:yes gene_type:complete
MIKLNKIYDIEKIKNEVAILLAEHELVSNQLLLQSVKGDDWYNIQAPYMIREDLRDWHFDTPNTKKDWEITRFIEENNIYRTRLMLLKPKKCYSWHKDYGERMHLSVITSPDCFFIENKQVLNIPADGHPYIVDVNNHHTALNCSQHDRYHLVGIIREPQ